MVDNREEKLLFTDRHRRRRRLFSERNERQLWSAPRRAVVQLPMQLIPATLDGWKRLLFHAQRELFLLPTRRTVA